MQDILKEVKILDDIDYFKEMIENENNELSNETQGEEDESENLETYDTTRESH
jgi:hypothetical protein